jgi:lipid II isoglutaminyl synthase (glutamine-hydrolysing)
VMFAVCAGFQILGHRYPAAGTERAGLGLLDVDSVRTDDARAVGELLADPIPASLDGTDVGPLTGFENHAARTRLGPAARPLGAVRSGVGNGFDSLEGAVQGRVIGTYLHGPALARNPALADLLLSWVVGELTPLAVDEVDQLRRERLIGQTGDQKLKGRSRTRAWRNWQTRWT